MKKYFLAISCLLFIYTSYSQVVNIESQRIKSDSTRFVLSDGLSFSYNDNNGKRLLQINNALSCQLKSKDLRHIYLLISKYKLIKAKDNDFVNVFFAHLRYNYKVNKTFRLESFLQYQNNLVLSINSRVIAGLGVRLKIIRLENLFAYAGFSYMYEFEQSKKYDQEVWQHRSSNYLSFTSRFPDSNFSLIGTIYFQPLYKDINDYRILSDIDLNYKLTKNLSLIMGTDYFLDTQTPKGEKQYYFHTKLGCKVSF